MSSPVSCPTCLFLLRFFFLAFFSIPTRYIKYSQLDCRVQTRGLLPPRILLETLVTLHIVLFPLVELNNRKSTKLLRKLIRTQSFDPESTWVEFVRPVPDDLVFTYWGARLSILADIVRRPPPTNSLVGWFERHTSERNALTTAILGLFLAALFGFLGVIIGVLQLVVAWRAWLAPVSIS